VAVEACYQQIGTCELTRHFLEDRGNVKALVS